MFFSCKIKKIYIYLRETIWLVWEEIVIARKRLAPYYNEFRCIFVTQACPKTGRKKHCGYRINKNSRRSSLQHDVSALKNVFTQ